MTVRPTSRFSSPELALLAPAAERRRYPAYVKHSEAAPEWYGYCPELTRNCPPSQCPSTASASLPPAFGGSSRWRVTW